MNKLNTKLISLLGIACLTMGMTSLSAAQEEQKQQLKVKHKVIQLVQQSDKPVNIEIVENGDAKVIEIDAREIKDPQALADKLSVLDDETRATVMQIIEDSAENQNKGMAFVHKLKDSDAITHFSKDKEVVFISNEDDVSFSGTLKGHHSAIVKLIEKGEFSREELDEIREALDAKY